MSVHDVIALACHDASCAPPPAGSGGSRRNTSVYPRDLHKKVKPSDTHSVAPGATNIEAVRGHRGQYGTDPERRIPRTGETVDVYRDLGKGREHKRGFPDGAAFSVRHASSADGNSAAQVSASTVGIRLTNGRPAWATSAKRAAEVADKRGVHAFIRGEVSEYLSPAQASAAIKGPGWKRITYYPGTQDFFEPETRHRFTGAKEIVLSDGKFYAHNPTLVASPAPKSKLEMGAAGVLSFVVMGLR